MIILVYSLIQALTKAMFLVETLSIGKISEYRK